MLWQAESGFWFRMAEGYLRPGTPKGFLDYNVHDPPTAEILRLARAKHVSRVLSLEIYGHPGPDQLRPLGALQLLGGVLVAPACGHPPITR